MFRTVMRPTVAAVAVAALVAAGCGDDDDAGSDTASAPAAQATGNGEAGAGDAGGDAADLDAYCGATLAIETVPPPEIDFASATPDEIAAGVADWVSAEMRPLVPDLLAVVPTALAADADIASGAVDEVAESGDFAVFERPDVSAAMDRMHTFDLANCGWAEVPVTTTEYAFEGIPAEHPAGPASFELANGGTEVHEIVIVRRNDGVTMPVEDLLALPEEDARAQVTQLAVVGPADPGGDEYAVVDLVPGDYIALCFIPTGTVSLDGPPPEGPPHAVHGMVAEFTVA